MHDVLCQVFVGLRNSLQGGVIYHVNTRLLRPTSPNVLARFRPVHLGPVGKWAIGQRRRVKVRPNNKKKKRNRPLEFSGLVFNPVEFIARGDWWSAISIPRK